MTVKLTTFSRLIAKTFLALTLALFSATNSLAAYSVGARVQAVGGWIIRTAPPTLADTSYRTVDGRLGTVTAGPTFVSPYNWYSVNWDSTSQDGWSTEESMILAPETIGTPGTISGQSSPIKGTSYTYSVGAVSSSMGHTIQYSFNWGDGTSSSWSTSPSATHSWSSTGQKTLVVTARCQTHTSITASNPGNSVTVTATPPTATTSAATSIGKNTATINGSVNPNGTTTVGFFEYGLTSSYGNTTATSSGLTGSSSIPLQAVLTGLSSGTTYHFRISTINSEGQVTFGSDRSFTTTATTPPAVTTAAASGIGTTTATLNGTVNPNGTSTSVYFEYGPTASYGNTTGSSSAQTGNSAISMQAPLSGLNSGATYHFRMVGINSSGQIGYGSDRTFTTTAATVAPTVTTAAASGIGTTTATLNGSVNPNGTSTAAGFDYGLTTSYGNNTASTPVLTGNSAIPVSANLTGLTPGTTYHFKLSAMNSVLQIGEGIDRTFTTTLALLPAPTLSGPANGMTGIATTPTFSWGAVADATSYRIMVATSAADLPTDPQADAGGPSVVINTTAATTSYTASPALNQGTTYYWTVKARNAAQFGAWASPRNFSTAGALLPAPTLSGPSDGATDISTTPTFSWNAAAGANRYWLMVATSPSSLPTDPASTTCPDCVSVGLSGITASTSYTPPSAFPYGGTTRTLSPNTTYYWRVQSWNTDGTQGNYSTIRSFTTAGILLPAPTLSGPANGMTGIATTPTFSWGAVADATSYRIMVATSAADLPTDPQADAGGPSVVINTTAATASYTASPALNQGTTYYWTVKARNAAQFGAWASPRSFATIGITTALSVISPNGGETYQAGTSLPISWTVSGNSAAVSSFRIAYTLDGGATWGVAHSYVSGSARSANWTTPAGASSSQCSISIVAFDTAGDVLHLDSSDGYFTISAPSTRPVARPDCNNPAPGYGQSVQFYGNWAYVASGLSIASYAWNFDDGTTSTARNPSHTFNPSATRTYTVTLTVTDSAGTPSYPKTLYVTVTGQALGPNTPQSKSDDPVNLATGNFLYDHTDLTIPGIGFPFTFQRFYNSKDTGNLDGPMGAYWSHSYAARTSTSNGMVRVTFGDGRSEIYTNSAGVYLAEPGIYNTLSTNANGTFALTTKEQTRYNFNAQGRLASIMDKNNNTLSLAYNGAGALTAATNSAGRAIAFVNDASSRIIMIVDPLSRTNSFAYSDQGDLISATDPRRGVTCYGYDADHQMTNAVDPNGNQFVRNVYNLYRVVESQRDALGFTTAFIYDFVTRETVVSNALGFRQVHKHDDKLRVIQIMDAAGNVQNFEYDDFNNRTKVIDKNRRTTSYSYDAKGNVISKTAPPEAGQEVGNTTTIAYDAMNNPTNRVDAKAGRTFFVFDNKGNLTKTVNPQSFTNTITYSSSGLPLAIRDANGNTHSNSYDTAGNLISTRDALGFVRYCAYDSGGRKTIEVEPNGATNRFTYDGNNNLTQSADPLGFTNVFSYDANNNPILIQDARGFQTTKSYDPKDRLVSVRDALGGVTSNIYDALDRKILTIDPQGNATRFAYDPVGNLLAVTNALGQATRYTYDAEGNQLTMRNALGQVSSNEYDALYRLIAVTDPIGHNTRYTYDELGRRTQVTDANSQVTRFQYDILGRLTNVIDAATGTVAYTFDKVGNRKTMKEPNGHVTSFNYDALNRLTSRTEPRGFLINFYDSVGNRIQVIDGQTNVTNYAYDLNKRMTNVTYQFRGATVGSVSFAYDSAGNRTQMVDQLGITTYAYDALNRMTNCTDSAGNAVAYEYDANGNRSSMSYPGNMVVNYTFDSLNRMVTVRDWLGGVTSNAYDSAGNLALIRNPNGTTALYTFDDAGRLISLTNSMPNANIIAAYNLTLDGVGNHIQSSQIDPIEPLIPTLTVSYAYDNDNRLTNAAGMVFTYDPNGNLLTKGADTFAYDLENRLTNAVVGGIVHQYQYDGLGNRLRATRGGVTTKYILDVNGTLAHVLAEADASGTITAFYVYGRGLVSRISAGGSAAYYHFDVRGSTVALTDSSANLTDSYAYDPFGTLVNSTGTLANPFKYVGHYGVMDEGNGLAYIRARYYSPALGRFVTKDPVTGKDGDSQSLNRYIYALNNPMSYVDVNGENPFYIAAGGYIFGSLFGAVSTAAGDIINSVSTRSFQISTRKEYAVSIVSSGVGGATVALTRSPLAGTAAKNATEQVLNGIIDYRTGQPVEQFDVWSYGKDIAKSWAFSKIPFLKRPVGSPTDNPITRYINGKNIEYYYGDKLIDIVIDASLTAAPAAASNVPVLPETESAHRKPNEL